MTFLIRTIILLSWLAGLGSAGFAQPDQLREVFEQRYQAWKSAYPTDPRFFSFPSSSQEFRDIVALGPQIVPFLIEKMEKNPDDPVDYLLGVAVLQITRKRWAEAEWPEPTRGDARTGARRYIHWWKEDRVRTGERFGELYRQWVALKAEKKTQEAQEEYKQIVNLGIAALPYLIDKVEQQPELIPAISKLTGGALPATATATGWRQWWGKNKQQFELPSH